MKKITSLFILLITSCCVFAQADPPPDESVEARAKALDEMNKKATEWVGTLAIADDGKKHAAETAIATHLMAVRDWNNTHPASLVPAGINPATGNKLSDLDRQFIACSTIPQDVHNNLMKALRDNLSPAQVDTILDRYTVGKVDFTMNGYHSIVPDLTAEEEAKLRGFLEQAREQAIDYKSMKLISAVFEIYKTKCEQYLNSNGRNWRALFKAYVDKVKAQKEADKAKKTKG